MIELYRKLKINIQKFIVKLFTKNPAPKSAPTKNADKNKTIQRIDQLKQELEALTNGYNKSIEELKKDYDDKLFHYEKHYQAYQEAHKKHVNKLINETELKQAKKQLQPHEEILRDAGAELDKVNQWLKEDTLEIIASIQDLKEDYTEAITEEIKEDASTLQELKKQHLNKIASIGKAYNDVVETEKLLKMHLNNNGVMYKETLKDTVKIKTKELQLNQFIISGEEVNKAMKGK
ncbi:hypothetical protein [Gracilibacillus saliphilus]|uniref:hypothetical protein n=1 Tax=Gracilibacillus saliphilus TaxID=543890 RepID=UPI0013D1C346|nr:hypothetical protein [Gracilibacillus saliphilus]